MFKAEMYRLLSKKVAVAAMLVALFFIIYFTMGNTVWGEGLIDDGEIYHGTAAIAKDKEIAAEFTGPLTEETVRAIWEKYGPPINYYSRSTTLEGMREAAAKGGNDNYCNRFVARKFGEVVKDEEGETTYVLAEGWTESRYLQGDYMFGYTGSSSWFWDRFLLAYILAHIAIIILLCPMFSEDYACRTADIILPTAKGRFFLWRLRMGVGCLLATAYYWLACGSIYLLYIVYYGTAGLEVSCGLSGIPVFYLEDSMSMGKGLLILYLCGWFSALVVAVVTCGISAGCRQTFSSLVRSLFFYIGPFAFREIVLDSLPMGVVNSLLRSVCYGMPLSYPGAFAEAPGGARVFLTAMGLAAALIGAGAGVWGHCRHQVQYGWPTRG